jgi:hypothetical protein
VNFDPAVRTILAQRFPEAHHTHHEGHPDRENNYAIPPVLRSTQFSRTILEPKYPLSVSNKSGEPTPDLTTSPDFFIGKSVLSGGNLRNNHFYLTGFLDRFPENSIGGPNKSLRAPKEITIDWGGPNLVHTDIDRTKRLFRGRGWVGNFFASTNAAEGDTVIVEQSGPYSFRVRLEKMEVP